MTDKDKIIFYDGECGLCNRSVQFVLKHEKTPVIQFSALQSAFAIDFFERNNYPQPDFSTFYFYSDNRLFQKSKAAFKVIPYLKWYCQPLRIFSVLPTSLTDFGYNFIAKRRKRIGGSFCVVPSIENRKRFIEKGNF